ncbi:MAG: cation transporter [Candidatus Omnitrophica bacterium]|nr:cation transporter [Candidatus Omnitrophota bacterium]
MEVRHEQNILTFSACGALFFALLALTWGFLAKSQMIMFDGIYSFISLLLTGLYLYASRSMAMGSDENFQFGRAQMEPMVIIVQSIVLLVICVKAFSGAVVSLFSGGQEINNISGMSYAAIGVIGCFFCWHVILRMAKKNAPRSELIKTLGSQWLMDTLLSLAVLIGFFIGYIIQRAGYEYYSRYMDSLMVVIAVLFFVREPIVSFITGIRGMLMMAPERRIYKATKKAMKKIAKEKGFDDIILRLGKSGRELVCEVGFVTKDPNNSWAIGEMDKIHREVKEELTKLFDSQLWLCVSFVHDKKLV